MGRVKPLERPPSIAMEHEPILWLALGTHRPHKSQGIALLVSQLIALAPKVAKISRDKNSNLFVDLRGESRSRTCFAAHLDTVAPNGVEGKIPLFFDKTGEWINTGGKHVLGADDGAGVAILTALMMARVPALYVFTQGEECGGDAARAAAEDPRLNNIDRCIAFDRKGTLDIVADQARGVLASHAFVDALSTALGLGQKWAIGSYTDSSEWNGKIKEIVNVSVGYEAQHSKFERLNYTYFKKLRRAVLRVDWESLPTVGPDPSANKNRYYRGRHSSPEPFWWEMDDYYSYGMGHKGQLTVGELTKLDKYVPSVDRAVHKAIQRPLPLVVTPRPWETEAYDLARALGFDPSVDDALVKLLETSLRKMYWDGNSAGWKQARTTGTDYRNTVITD